MVLPFDGLKTGPDRLDRLASQRPPISIGTEAGVSRSTRVVAMGGSPWKGFDRHLNIESAGDK